MTNILSITLPIFLLIGVGYLAAYFKFVSPTDIASIGRFVLYFPMPALIIVAFQSHPIGQILNWSYLIAYGGGSIASFWLTTLCGRYVLKKDFSTSAIYGMGTSVSNSAYIGYPVVSAIIGPLGAICMALNFLVENIIIIPMSLMLADAGSEKGTRLSGIVRQILSRLFQNPIIIGIVLGLAISLSGVVLPGPVDKALTLLSAVASPTALFVIGGSLVGLRLKGMRGDISLVFIFKLVVHPLMAFISIMVFVPTIEPEFAIGAILFASVPMMSIYPIFAEAYQLGQRAAAAVFVATMLSFFTIPVAVTLVHALFPLG
ncbi:AEC family transporter [uncultured Cohaesibacter sp.]|uniref:AEC family transporter n=1 Tax=uncultured Cohaesibacter sp. TaxID=1002546 RepID=UPI002AAB758B|nr:AEC family transporter [uncultured Cohaesibacter sp.]